MKKRKNPRIALNPSPTISKILDCETRRCSGSGFPLISTEFLDLHSDFHREVKFTLAALVRFIDISWHSSVRCSPREERSIQSRIATLLYGWLELNLRRLRRFG